MIIVSEWWIHRKQLKTPHNNRSRSRWYKSLLNWLSNFFCLQCVWGHGSTCPVLITTSASTNSWWTQRIQFLFRIISHQTHPEHTWSSASELAVNEWMCWEGMMDKYYSLTARVIYLCLHLVSWNNNNCNINLTVE